MFSSFVLIYKEIQSIPFTDQLLFLMQLIMEYKIMVIMIITLLVFLKFAMWHSKAYDDHVMSTLTTRIDPEHEKFLIELHRDGSYKKRYFANAQNNEDICDQLECLDYVSSDLTDDGTVTELRSFYLTTKGMLYIEKFLSDQLPLN